MSSINRYPCTRVAISEDLGFERHEDGTIYLVRDTGDSYERLCSVSEEDIHRISEAFT